MDWSAWAGSGIIHWKWEEPVKSSMGERASGWRRRDLEKKRMSARRRLVEVLQREKGGGGVWAYAF